MRGQEESGCPRPAPRVGSWMSLGGGVATVSAYDIRKHCCHPRTRKRDVRGQEAKRTAPGTRLWYYCSDATDQLQTRSPHHIFGRRRGGSRANKTYARRKNERPEPPIAKFWAGLTDVSPSHIPADLKLSGVIAWEGSLQLRSIYTRTLSSFQMAVKNVSSIAEAGQSSEGVGAI